MIPLFELQLTPPLEVQARPDSQLFNYEIDIAHQAACILYAVHEPREDCIPKTTGSLSVPRGLGQSSRIVACFATICRTNVLLARLQWQKHYITNGTSFRQIMNRLYI